MEKNTKEEEFFNTREIKATENKESEMDTSFVEPKKHHTFAKFIIFLLIIIIALACVYYFVLDTPKKTYTTVINKLSKTSSINSKENNYSYSISTNINGDDKSNEKLFNIINKIQISGITKYDNDLMIGNNNIKYNNEKLLDITYNIDLTSPTLYLKLNEVLDKVIKIDISSEEITKSVDINKNDYLTVINSLINDFKLSLENANFERKITKLNNNYVFKETLVIDESFVKDFLTKLLHDDDFLQSYAKIEKTSVSKVNDMINESLANLDVEKTTIYIYKRVLKNEILKVEILSEDNNITINKEGNKYSYEFIENNELECKGYIIIEKNNNETKEIINVELIKEKVSLELNITYSKNNNNIPVLDTKDAADYSKLTEEDYNKIMTYVQDNKAFTTLLEDLEISNSLNETNNM